MDPLAYQARLDALTAAYEAGEYDLAAPQGEAYYLGSKADQPAEDDTPEVLLRKALKTIKGRMYLAAQVFGCTESDVIRFIRDGRGAEVATLLQLVSRESLLTDGEREEVAEAEGADPNAPPAA
jgi:hypothetical protein